MLVAGTVTSYVEAGTVTAYVEAGTITAYVGNTITAVVDAGTVTSYVQAGTITAYVGNTITAIVDAGTITAFTSAGFSETNQTYDNLTATASFTAFTIDTSKQSMYSFYVYNNHPTAAITAFLQISPSTTDPYFTNDPSGATSISAGNMNVLVAEKFLQYTRLILQTGPDTGSAVVYFNGQT